MLAEKTNKNEIAKNRTCVVGLPNCKVLGLVQAGTGRYRAAQGCTSDGNKYVKILMKFRRLGTNDLGECIFRSQTIGYD